MSIKQKYKSIFPDGRWQFITFLTPIFHHVYDDPTNIEYEKGELGGIPLLVPGQALP